MYKRPLKKIPADVVENVQVKLDEVTTLLIPYAVILELNERRFFPKMKNRIFEFVELSRGFACETPELTPS